MFSTIRIFRYLITVGYKQATYRRVRYTGPNWTLMHLPEVACWIDNWNHPIHDSHESNISQNQHHLLFGTVVQFGLGHGPPLNVVVVPNLGLQQSCSLPKNKQWMPNFWCSWLLMQMIFLPFSSHGYRETGDNIWGLPRAPPIMTMVGALGVERTTPFIKFQKLHHL